MSWKMTPFAAAIVVAGGIAATSAGFAQNPPPSTPAPQGQGMMGGQQGQGNMGDMMNMMTQMNDMMATCNNMMKSANQKPAAPATPPVQGKPG